MTLTLSSAHAAFSAASRSTLEDLSRGGHFDLFLVARATDRWWTPLTAVRATDALPVHLGTHFPVEATACHRLLVDRRPVVARDLRRHGDAQVRENSRAHHVAGYAGAAIRRPDGRLLGSLCAFSASRFEGDVDPVVARLHEGAERLARQLGTALDVLADERRKSFDHAQRSADDATRLPDRRGWGLMLRDEEDRSRDLTEDAAVVLVDMGLVRRAVPGLDRPGVGRLRPGYGGPAVVDRAAPRRPLPGDRGPRPVRRRAPPVRPRRPPRPLSPGVSTEKLLSGGNRPPSAPSAVTRRGPGQPSRWPGGVRGGTTHPCAPRRAVSAGPRCCTNADGEPPGSDAPPLTCFFSVGLTGSNLRTPDPQLRAGDAWGSAHNRSPLVRPGHRPPTSALSSTV